MAFPVNLPKIKKKIKKTTENNFGKKSWGFGIETFLIVSFICHPWKKNLYYNESI